MDEGIVFQFLHPLQLAELTEGLFEYLFCDSACQVPYKQHFDLLTEYKNVAFQFAERGTNKTAALSGKVTQLWSYISQYATYDLWPRALPWP